MTELERLKARLKSIINEIIGLEYEVRRLRSKIKEIEMSQDDDDG